jgi:calpain-15
MNRSISFVANSVQFNNIKEAHERKGMKYRDQQFPADFKSLFGFGESRSLNQKRLRSLVWHRPKVIFGGRNFDVFQGKIDPSDIVQGMLGDCYFLSAISAIAEKESRIKKLFLQRTVSKSGAYCVALCLNGMWEEVIVDDLFPCYPQRPKPAFNCSKKNEIWVMLLEKAWAKVHGGYLNIDGGLTREALHDLTGAPAITYYTDELTEEAHWKNISKGDQKDFIMTAGSHDITGTGRDNRDPKTGLCGNHAYSLLSAYELVQGSRGLRLIQPGEKSSPNNVRLVELRNPWGKGEWKGEWSDRDRRWTPELAKAMNHSLKEDGKFLMPFKTFLKYFHDYQMCFFHDNYVYSAQRYNSKPSAPSFVHFQIRHPGPYFISINQINKRFFRSKDSNFPFKNLRLCLHSSYSHGGEEVDFWQRVPLRRDEQEVRQRNVAQSRLPGRRLHRLRKPSFLTLKDRNSLEKEREPVHHHHLRPRAGRLRTFRNGSS